MLAHFIVIFILAVITHYVMAGIGGYLDTAGGILNWKYAEFTFSPERNISMTTNILMNIFIPNVVMFFIYAGTVYLKWYDVQPLIWLFVVFYYFYRMILICVLQCKIRIISCNFRSCVSIFAFN